MSSQRLLKEWDNKFSNGKAIVFGVWEPNIDEFVGIFVCDPIDWSTGAARVGFHFAPEATGFLSMAVRLLAGSFLNHFNFCR
eukprot:TRINITY_DN3784_c0_g1_i1.p3 TRINITY_DN3784_c0_g1~~TRINITY_DN3784_c0_g1_i1.p3  ORF type:complete len:82 (-),score=6.05 TRINITY_DN3784_c0_g1_i1:366-611(-)